MFRLFRFSSTKDAVDGLDPPASKKYLWNSAVPSCADCFTMFHHAQPLAEAADVDAFVAGGLAQARSHQFRGRKKRDRLGSMTRVTNVQHLINIDIDST